MMVAVSACCSLDQATVDWADVGIDHQVYCSACYPPSTDTVKDLRRCQIKWGRTRFDVRPRRVLHCTVLAVIRLILYGSGQELEMKELQKCR